MRLVVSPVAVLPKLWMPVALSLVVSGNLSYELHADVEITVIAVSDLSAPSPFGRVNPCRPSNDVLGTGLRINEFGTVAFVVDVGRGLDSQCSVNQDRVMSFWTLGSWVAVENERTRIGNVDYINSVPFHDQDSRWFLDATGRATWGPGPSWTANAQSERVETLEDDSSFSLVGLQPGGDSVWVSSSNRIERRLPEGLTDLIAESGAQAPGFDGLDVSYSTFATDIAVDGAAIVFKASLEGPGVNSYGLFQYFEGQVQLVSADDVFSWDVSSTGQVVFQDQNKDVWRGFPGDLERLPSFSSFDPFLRINERGDVLTSSMLVSDGRTFEFNLIDQVNDPNRRPLAINDAGQLVMVQEIDRSVGRLMGGYPDSLAVIVEPGDDIEVAPGDIRTVATLFFAGGSSNDDGNIAFNVDGQFVFRLVFEPIFGVRDATAAICVGKLSQSPSAREPSQDPFADSATPHVPQIASPCGAAGTIPLLTLVSLLLAMRFVGPRRTATPR